eukprot:c6352_g1_i1 orf=2-178(-)
MNLRWSYTIKSTINPGNHFSTSFNTCATRDFSFCCDTSVAFPSFISAGGMKQSSERPGT